MTFERVALDLHARALDLVRQSVITRRCAPDRPVDVGRLAQELELPEQLVHRELSTLVGEGLVTRQGEHEVVVTAVDRRMVEQAFQARSAIELGVAELTVGRVSRAELRELRDRAWATAALVAGGQPVDIDADLGLDAAFHEYLVGLADSDALIAAYRRLSLPVWVTGRHAPADAVLSREHLALVDAYEAGSLDEAKRAITAHNDHAQGIGEAAVLAAGGRI
jgi:DNA-binding GntR family transcriptional regulator